MAYTPVELRHVALKRGPLGYRRGAVDALLNDVASSFEDVWRDRADLADRAEQLETEVERLREREALLANTLLAAERASEEAREDARRKSEQLLAEAHAEARAITRSAIAERERLLGEVRRIKALLHAALDAVEEGEHGSDAEEALAREAWPRPDDTREFDAPPVPSLSLPEPDDPHDAH